MTQIIHTDYSSLELRTLAHYADNMIFISYEGPVDRETVTTIRLLKARESTGERCQFYYDHNTYGLFNLYEHIAEAEKTEDWVRLP